MNNEKVTPQDLKLTMSRRGLTDAIRQDKVIQRLQVTGCLIAMTSDILDTLFADEEDLLRQLEVTYKHEQKMHKNGMKQAYEKFHYHMGGFNKSFFGNDKFGANLEDNAQDLYDIIKLIADHTNDHKDMENIKRGLRRRKLNHHIFDD